MQSCKANELYQVFNHVSLRNDVQVEDKIVEVLRNHQIAAIQFALSAIVISNILLEILALIRKSTSYRYYILRLQSHWNIVILELVDVWVSSKDLSQNFKLRNSEVFSRALQKVKSLLNSELSHLIAFSCICLISQCHIRFSHLPFIIIEYPYWVGSIAVLLSLFFPDFRDTFKLFIPKDVIKSREEIYQPNNISSSINITQSLNLSSSNKTTNRRPTNESVQVSPLNTTEDNRIETSPVNKWRSTLSYIVESVLLLQMNTASDGPDSFPVPQSKRKGIRFGGILLLLLPAMRWLLSINYFLIRTKYIVSDVWGWHRSSGRGDGDSNVWRRLFPRKKSYKPTKMQSRSSSSSPSPRARKNDSSAATAKKTTKNNNKKKRINVDATPIVVPQQPDGHDSTVPTPTSTSTPTSTATSSRPEEITTMQEGD